MSSRAWLRARRIWDHAIDRLRGRAVEVRAGETARTATAVRRPTFDVLESEHELIVRCDVPGTPREAFDVRVNGDRLIVAADPYHRGELRLPAAVAARGAHGSLHRGVLTLHLPKARAAAAATSTWSVA